MSSRRSIGNTFDVTTVTDGTNGTNAFSVDLSNEMDSVACDSDMKTAAAFNIYSQIAAFYGVEDVTALCQIRYTSKPTNASLTLETSGSGTGSTSLTTTFQTISTKQWIRIHYNSGVAVSKRETLEVEIKHATYGTIALSIAVVGMKGGAIYNLVPSANAITHKKDGTYTPNVITCGSSKLDVATGTTSSNPSEATIKYSADGGSVTNYPSGGLTAGTNFTNYVTFFLYVNNTVVDKETVNIVTDGTNGTNGKDGKDGKDGQDGADGLDGAQGYGYALLLNRDGLYTDANWATYAEIGHSESYSHRSGDSAFAVCRVGDIFVVSGTSSDTGLNHTATYRCTAVSSGSITGTCLSHVKDGLQGARGKTGRFYYYAGVWSGNTDVYVVSDAEAPYFAYGNSYYVFNPESNGSYTQAQMGTPSNSGNWKIMTNDFKYLITEAIFGAFAHFGTFIISGDWMLSENGYLNGTLYTGSDTYSGVPAYTYFDAQYPQGTRSIGITSSSVTSTTSSRKTNYFSMSGKRVVKISGKVTSGGTMYVCLYLSSGSAISSPVAITSTSGASVTINFGSAGSSSCYIGAYMANSSYSGTITAVSVESFAPNYAVDGLTGKSYQNDAYLKGLIYATGGTITGDMNITGSLTIGTYGANQNSIMLSPSSTNPSIVGYVGTTEVFRIGTQVNYDGSTLPTIKIGQGYLRGDALLLYDSAGSNCRAYTTRFIVERVANSLHYPFSIDINTSKKVILKANGKDMWPTSKSEVGWGGVYVDGTTLRVNMDG